MMTNTSTWRERFDKEFTFDFSKYGAIYTKDHAIVNLDWVKRKTFTMLYL